MAIDLLVSAAQGLGPAAATTSGGATQAGGGIASIGKGFSDLLDNVEKTASDANSAVTSMVDKTGDVHEAMIALQRAEMALEFTVAVRNKFVQAYQDIMRMPI